ncbi:MAG TPA: class I SAM-dependent methyltransferase [Vicinamibacterales bacterium]
MAILHGESRSTGWREWGRTLSHWPWRTAAPAPARVLPAADAYALWAETYPPRAHNPVMAAEQAVMAPLLASLLPQRALDVGTGTGRNLPCLAAAGARHIVGVDLSMPMLVRGIGRGRSVCADALHLPFRSRTFDVVCSSLMVGDIADVDAWVGEAARLLARQGHLVYSDFHPAWSESGWRRTFRTADGEQIELCYFSHSLSQHLAALDRAGLEVRIIREPRVDGRQAPVIVLFHAVKP